MSHVGNSVVEIGAVVEIGTMLGRFI